MGQVYLAEDTSLERQVALKFLPQAMQADETARKRFQREAKSAAALDHPFICHIHEIGEAEGQGYIAMEYVQGVTLKDKIAEGPLPLKNALQMASEIAEAIQEAHNHNIVHRDLKPSNIMITPGGHVKVMDFGLAKRVVSDQAGTEEVQLTSLTKEGSTVGTIPYMSPEQLTGKAVDTRSDIFSFGIILYEMLAGVHPFLRAEAMETAGAILNQGPPPLARYREEISELLQHTVKKMLAKEVNERYQSVHEVRTDLAEVTREVVRNDEGKQAPAQSSGFGPSDSPSRWLWQAGLVAVVAIVLTLLAVWFWPRLEEADRTVSEVPGPPTRITDRRGEEVFPDLSPNGETIIYASRETGNWDIYWKRLAGGTPRNLTEQYAGDDNAPVFSPDGQQIAFSSEREGGGIFVMGATGESPRQLTDFGYYPDWSPDGKQIVFCSERRLESRAVKSELWRIGLAAGAEARRI